NAPSVPRRAMRSASRSFRAATGILKAPLRTARPIAQVWPNTRRAADSGYAVAVQARKGFCHRAPTRLYNVVQGGSAQNETRYLRIEQAISRGCGRGGLYCGRARRDRHGLEAARP